MKSLPQDDYEVTGYNIVCNKENNFHFECKTHTVSVELLYYFHVTVVYSYEHIKNIQMKALSVPIIYIHFMCSCNNIFVVGKTKPD